jgi:hypothetical protein
MPQAGIHGMLLVSCSVPGVVFTAHQSPAERTNSST